MDFNRLFCRSNVHVTHTISIATKLASVKAFVKSLTTPNFAFAPIAA